MSELDDIKARIADCSTYNFGMRNADKLAHEDAGKLVAALDEVDRLCRYLESLADGDKHYAKLIREAVTKGLA